MNPRNREPEQQRRACRKHHLSKALHRDQRDCHGGAQPERGGDERLAAFLNADLARYGARGATHDA